MLMSVSRDRHAFYIYCIGIYADSVQNQCFSLPSFAKVNLNLRVLGRRDDGFHEIVTVLQTISLQDTLTFELSDKRIELTCDDPNVPIDETNLIVRAARDLQHEFRVRDCARIGLKKEIPLGGGLGGGSSNAATTLIGLSRLWSLDVDGEKLNKIASGLGSDVPFFLHGGTAMAVGTGTTIKPMDDIDLGPMIIVAPNVKVSTREAYVGLQAPSLTTADSERILLNYRLEAVEPLKGSNDFEKTVFAAFPEIANIKAKLIEQGAIKALLSGSGASVFGIFENEETRQTALKALGEFPDWRSFAVAAFSRSEYREKLGL